MRTLLLATAIAAIAMPALAGEGLFCTGPDGIDLHVPLAAGPGLNPLAAEISTPGGRWTMEEGADGAVQIVPAQSVALDDRYYLDFADANYEGKLVEIRVFAAHSDDAEAYGGTLLIHGAGAWAIACDFG